MLFLNIQILLIKWNRLMLLGKTSRLWNATISPDKARKRVINPLKTGIYALVGISERTFTR